MRKQLFSSGVQNEHLFLLALAAITAVVAVGAVNFMLAVIFWFLTVALMIVAFCWDYIRWQFLPSKIREQIKKGVALRSDMDGNQIREWDNETLRAIDEEWGKSSFQYKCFDALCESPYPDPLLMLEWKLICLKGLATAWFGPPQWKR